MLVSRNGDILLFEETEKVTHKPLFRAHFILTKLNKLQTFLADRSPLHEEDSVDASKLNVNQ